MNQIIVHRCVYWRDGENKQRELHGLRNIAVPDMWSPLIGVMVDCGNDPYMPEDFSGVFATSGGAIVVLLPWWSNKETNGGCTPLETCETWFDVPWKWLPRYFDLYEMSVADVVENLQPIKSGIDAMFHTNSESINVDDSA